MQKTSNILLGMQTVYSDFIRSPCTEVREPGGRLDAIEAELEEEKVKDDAKRDDGGDGCNRTWRGGREGGRASAIWTYPAT